MSGPNRNDERTVRCPVDDCGKEVLARGLYLHVLRSSGNGHGPQNEIPDHVDLDNVEEIGTQEVEMNYPDERDTEKVARLCPYCERPFTGKQGVLIHLGQVAGRMNHPKNAGERHSEEDFPKVEVDEFGNVTRVVNDTVDSEDVGPDKGDVPRQQVYRIIAELIANGETVAAHRVRKSLLGTGSSSRPVRRDVPHMELYEALMTHSDSEEDVSAALEREGVMVAVGQESGFYNADEARDVVAVLEQHTPSDDQELRDLAEFLRYSADELEAGRVGRGRHEEFQHWRDS